MSCCCHRGCCCCCGSCGLCCHHRYCRYHCPYHCFSPCRPGKLSTSPLTNSFAGSTMNETGAGRLTGSPSRGGDKEIRKISPNLSLRLSPERRFSPNRRGGSPLRGSNSFNDSGNFVPGSTTNMRPYVDNDREEKDKLLEYFRKVMREEGDLERTKTSLALKDDFNVEDAYRIFELDGRGFLTEDDISAGLDLLGVAHTPSDVRKLMKKYDNSRTGTLNYADFFDIVTPYEKDLRDMVENRPPISCCPCHCPDVFCCPTRINLKNLFDEVIGSERRINNDRMGMSLTRAKLPSLFKDLDRYGLGYFTEDDLRNYLQKNYSLTNEKNKDLLFIRLDKNRNGRIERTENQRKSQRK